MNVRKPAYRLLTLGVLLALATCATPAVAQTLTVSPPMTVVPVRSHRVIQP